MIATPGATTVYIVDHMEKLARIDALLHRLDPAEDFELWAWMSMTGATHAVNAALHRLGLTREDGNYAFHVIGLYVVPPSVDGRWNKRACPPGDIVHVDAPPVAGAIPSALAAAFAALRTLEDLREPYIRGGEPVTPAVIEATAGAYRTCITSSAEAATGGRA